MLVGYNHNIGYKGEVFHVQTEDSGINTPHIITLLYRGGNILASKKTSYADIVKMGNLSQVVEELMKEQHKDMLRRLKNGEFDERLGLKGVFETPPALAPEPPSAPVSPAAVTLLSALSPVKVESAPVIAQAVPPQVEIPKKQQSLDDLIFDFLSASDEKH
jgi:hypothetical protein